MKDKIYFYISNSYRFLLHHKILFISFLITTFIIYFTPILLSDILDGNIDDTSESQAFLILLVLPILVPVVIVLLVVELISKGSEGESKRSKVINIILSFALTTYLFSAVYFVVGTIGDLAFEVNKIMYYDSNNELKEGNHYMPKFYGKALKPSFNGMNTKVFTGVNYPPFKLLKETELKYCKGAKSIEDYHLNPINSNLDSCYLELIKERDLEEIITYLPENSTDYFVECLHFSTHFSLAFGYSEIQPNLISLKLITDLQLIINAFLILFGLNFILSDFELVPKQTKREKADK